jgi:hypothetical protein
MFTYNQNISNFGTNDDLLVIPDCSGHCIAFQPTQYVPLHLFFEFPFYLWHGGAGITRGIPTHV